MGKGIVKLGEGQWAVKDGNLLAAKETNGRFKNTEFTVSRGTRASYVGRDGLIKESNLQDVNLVNNGDFSELGSEVVTNGDFTNDINGWISYGSTSTYDDGTIKTTSTSNTAWIRQNDILTVGETFKVTFKAKASNISQTIKIWNGSSFEDTGLSFDTENTYKEFTYYLKFENDSPNLIIGQQVLSVNDTINFDNVSVKEVDPNDYWNLGTGWSIEDGVAASDGVSGNSNLVQENILTVGKTYKVSVDVTRNSGEVRFYITSDPTATITSSGTYTFYGVCDRTDLDLHIKSVYFDGTIDNISIQEVKTDTPRIDFTDNTDGHLLLEPQSTNLVPYSEDFSEWTIQSGTTVTSNTTETLSPSGEYNSSKIVGNGTSGILKSYLSSLGGSNTKSIFIKGTQNGQVVYLKDPNQTVNNKALTLTTEWVRYSLTETQTSHYGIWISNIPTEGIYMWGGQVEALSYPTSYIPTNGSTVTRDADTCTGAGSSADFNSEEGVLYAEISALADSTTTTIFSLSNGTNANSLYMGFSSTSNTIQAQLVVGNVAQTNMNYVVTDRTQFNKVAVLYENNNHKMYINGSEVAVDTSGSVPSANTFDRLNFDLGQGSFDFYGKVKAVRVYKEALSDTDLQNLTS
jgi:hypothetical protein